MLFSPFVNEIWFIKKKLGALEAQIDSYVVIFFVLSIKVQILDKIQEK